MNTNSIDFRRWQNRLISTGKVLKFFCLWSVVKAFLILMMYAGDLLAQRGLSFVIEVVVIVAIVTLIAVFIQLHIAKAAEKEAMGKKPGILYLVLSVIYLIFQVLAIVLTVIMYMNGENNEFILDSVLSIALDAAGLFVSLELLVSAYKVKQIRKNEIVKEGL